jgi:hypothetical protein
LTPTTSQLSPETRIARNRQIGSSAAPLAGAPCSPAVTVHKSVAEVPSKLALRDIPAPSMTSLYAAHGSPVLTDASSVETVELNCR